jgi:hypothetical protein
MVLKLGLRSEIGFGLELGLGLPDGKDIISISIDISARGVKPLGMGWYNGHKN